MADKKLNQNEQDANPKPVNEIDEFAQKLLDKKVELALFPEDDDITSESLHGTMSEAQRKTAESSMLSALDQLRKERGQSTIEEEEERYRRLHGYKEETDEPAPSKEKKNKAEDDFVAVEPNRYETRHREDHFEKAEKRPEPEKFYQKKKFWIYAALIAVLLVLFAGYAWKTTVYDPAHQADPAQTEAYDRLVNYADEYSMMSDAQKKDILKLESDFNSLPEAKKTEINEYFQNPKHTGQSFTDLLAATKQTQVLSENPGMQELLNYASSYNSLDQAGKDDIVNRLNAYNGLNEEGKSQVNNAFVSNTGKDFMALYDETRARLDAQNAQAAQEQTDQQAGANVQTGDVQDEAAAAQIAAQSAELDQLRIDRDNYVYFLTSEGYPLEGDEVLASYDAQIAALEAALGQ